MNHHHHDPEVGRTFYVITMHLTIYAERNELCTELLIYILHYSLFIILHSDFFSRKYVCNI